MRERILAAAALSLALVGCEPTPNQPAPTPTSTISARTPEASATIPADVRNYYEQLAGHKFTSGTLDVEKGLHVTYYNFTNEKLNIKAATTMYDYFLDNATTMNTLTGGTHLTIQTPTGPIPAIIKARPDRDVAAPRTNILFLVPANTTPPSWETENPLSSTVSYSTKYPNVRLTYVREATESDASKQSMNPHDLTKLALTIETCQSTVVVESNSSDNAHVAQEAVCNSWAFAYALRQKKLSYEQYTQAIKEYTSYPGIKIIPLPKQFYEKIHVDQEVIAA